MDDASTILRGVKMQAHGVMGRCIAEAPMVEAMERGGKSMSSIDV
jgi:hypothetical protein